MPNGQQLSEKYKEKVIALYLEGNSLVHIAQSMKVTKNSICGLVSRLREKHPELDLNRGSPINPGEAKPEPPTFPPDRFLRLETGFYVLPVKPGSTLPFLRSEMPAHIPLPPVVWLGPPGTGVGVGP